MSRPYLTVLIAACTLPLLSGCASSGVFYSAHTTNVQLQEENYEVIATNVEGDAKAGYLVGVSGMLYGPKVATVALIPIAGERDLYSRALAELWDNFEFEYFDPEGRSVALVNVRYDSESLNVLGLYTRPLVSVRADVVEFDD